MKHAFFLALATVAGLALGVACGEDETTSGTNAATGTPSSTTSAASGGTSAGGSTSQTGGSTASAGGQGGAGQGGGEAGDACGECIEPLVDPGGTCEAQFTACEDDNECGAWLECIEDCAKDDFTAACVDACDQTHAAASNLFGPVATCVCGACANVCSPLC